MLTTQKQVRAAFWAQNPGLTMRLVNGPRRPVPAPQNMQPTDTRIAFVDFVDYLNRDGKISDALANRVNL